MKGFEPNLLEKLFDANASSAASVPVVLRRLNVEELKESVARDIERLLNTRMTCTETTLGRYEQCQRSVVTYGLGDFAGRSLRSFDDRAYICHSIERAVARHEPRLKHVRVTLAAEAGSVKSLCFSISAMLVVKPVNDPVNFDAVLQASSLKYAVKQGRKLIAE